jgi:predicted permease
VSSNSLSSDRAARDTGVNLNGHLTVLLLFFLASTSILPHTVEQNMTLKHVSGRQHVLKEELMKNMIELPL